MMEAGKRKKIAALTIGQTPRPDLIDPLINLLPNCDVVEIGALDGLADTQIKSVTGAAYPLSTRLRSGKSVLVTEAETGANLRQRCAQLSMGDYDAGILLCAGTFADLNIEGLPLIKPFEVGRAMLQAIIATKIGVIAPFPDQERPIQDRWKMAGFDPIVWTQPIDQIDTEIETELNQKIETHELRALVLDYFGHPLEQVRAFQRISSVPVIDLGSVAMDMLVSKLG